MLMLPSDQVFGRPASILDQITELKVIRQQTATTNLLCQMEEERANALRQELPSLYRCLEYWEARGMMHSSSACDVLTYPSFPCSSKEEEGILVFGHS